MPQSPQVADTAPDEPFLTGYDMAHLVTYLRLLDADAEGADWREVAAIVLELDVAKDTKAVMGEPSRAGQMDDRERLSLSPARRAAELSTQSAWHPGDLSRLPAGSNTSSRMRGSYERACDQHLAVRLR